MIRSTINGQIIKGEVYTKIDIDKIAIRFVKVGELNFTPTKGEKILYGIHANGCNINVYEDIEISLVSIKPFNGLPLREADEYKEATEYQEIDMINGFDNLVKERIYYGEIIDMYIIIPKDKWKQ